MAEKTYSEVLEKVTKLGIDSLTLEEKKILKSNLPDPEKMIDTDKYSELQTGNIKTKQAKGIPLTDTEKTVLVGKELDNKNELVDVIISGQNDVWTKTYDYTKDGGLKFTISIKAPTIVEEGQIRTLLQNYLGGTAIYWDDFTVGVYSGLSLIRICGKQVPDVFKDDDKIYAVVGQWLYNIYTDFSEWQSRFRY